MGCFSDNGGDRALPFRIPGNRKSATQCQTECAEEGFKYAGRQYLGQCWCGNSGYSKHGVSNCGDCNGENVGAYRSCVWEVFTEPATPTIPPVPTPVPTPAPTNTPSVSIYIRAQLFGS